MAAAAFLTCGVANGLIIQGVRLNLLLVIILWRILPGLIGNLSNLHLIQLPLKQSLLTA